MAAAKVRFTTRYLPAIVCQVIFFPLRCRWLIKHITGGLIVCIMQWELAGVRAAFVNLVTDSGILIPIRGSTIRRSILERPCTSLDEIARMAYDKRELLTSLGGVTWLYTSEART